MAPAAPVLDARTTEDFLGQALALARTYCPDWSAGWPTPIDPAAVDADPGLAMLNLFALLGKYLGDVENRIPDQRRLAFYSFVGLTLRPPVAARAPLVFRLRDDRPSRFVPARTAVLDAPTQAVRFETTDDLLVLPATLAAAVTLIPAQDQMIDVLPRLGGDDPICAFGGTPRDPAVRQIGHWFLIGDPALFTPDTATRRLTLTMTGRDLHPAYFDQWFDGDLTPLRARASASADGLSLTIELLDMPATKLMTVGDLQQALDKADGGPSVAPNAVPDDAKLGWLVVKPAPAIRIVGALNRQLPVITGLTCVASGDAAPAQQAVTGTAPWTIGNGGYPFGQTPAINDAFYLRADDVLAKAGAQVVVSFDLQPPGTRHDATVEWQFWDGKGWASFNATSVDVSLHQFADTTDALQGDRRGVPAEIAFVCPTIPCTTVAGITGRWIRAVLTAGGYGAPGGYTTDPVDATIARVPSDILTDDEKHKLTAYLTQTARIGFGVRFDAGSQAPPFVRGVRIAYRRSATPQRYWTYNALSLTRFLFRPYRPVESQATALYLGFEPQGFVAHAAGKALTLLIHVVNDPSADTSTAPRWHALDGDDWQPLVVDDGTHALSRSGIVRLAVPTTMMPAPLFSRTLCWFRVISPNPDVRLCGIYPNAVWAENAVRIEEEILGSATGALSQRLTLARAPVLPGLALDVAEPQALQPISEPLSVTATDAALPANARVRRRWRQVDDFAFSGPADRVYTLDPANGLVTFGDGRNGMVPPPGNDNVIAAHYATTRGMAGDVAAGALSVLRPGISDIAAVTNPVAAFGGADGDTRETVAATGPARVAARGRAIGVRDLATIALAASPQVARAAVLTDPDERLRIIVLPRATAPRPIADPALIDRVTREVTRACSATLVPRIAGASPAPIAITAQVTTTTPADQRLAVQQAIETALQGFLHPVFGGPDGTGWPIGGDVAPATVATFLRRQPGVTGVPGLTLTGVVPVDSVPVAGAMTVYAYPDDGTA